NDRFRKKSKNHSAGASPKCIEPAGPSILTYKRGYGSSLWSVPSSFCRAIADTHLILLNEDAKV
ncbi:MAG: hypothetical protein QGH62_04830, partial [Nitrospinaceae bacterium]|nr:hypothetical protein [Nitrospinaceae bacterium]